MQELQEQVNLEDARAHTHTHAHTQTHTHTHMHTHTETQTYKLVRTRLHMHVYTRRGTTPAHTQHTHTHTDAHTHTHTRTHTLFAHIHNTQLFARCTAQSFVFQHTAHSTQQFSLHRTIFCTSGDQHDRCTTRTSPGTHARWRRW